MSAYFISEHPHRDVGVPVWMPEICAKGKHTILNNLFRNSLQIILLLHLSLCIVNGGITRIYLSLGAYNCGTCFRKSW